MSSSSLTQTLNSITATKLQVLSKQHADFDAHSAKTLASLKDAGSPLQRVQLLADGLESWRKSCTASSSASIYIENVKRFLDQAQLDPTIGEATVREWESNLKKAMDMEKVKFEYAELFGRLLKEWIASSDRPASVAENVGRKEMHRQRAMFDSHVFTAKETDAAAITAYLEELFSPRAANKCLEKMRKDLEKFGSELLLKTTFTVEDLEWAIQALLTADLLSNEKRETLQGFTRNKTVLTEVADVLNMHLAALSSWSWAPEGGAIPVEIRRQINGKYRIYMDEEILQAIFLHWIGLKWSVEFKRCFQTFFTSAAWKPSTQPLTKDENERREYFLREYPSSYEDNRWGIKTIASERRRKQEKLFFMSMLPGSLEKPAAAYDSDGDEKDTKDSKQPSAEKIKLSLLHILATDCLFNTALHGEFTAVRSDFTWFGPSLPHTSILAVHEFFGVSKPWLTFFQKFLAAPLQYIDDGPSAPTQIRKCGVPVAHGFSSLFGEVILFCMDYSVNQRADGLFLYRIFDDFWWWSPNPTTCVKAWQEMNKFARLVGIEMNAEKTGSVCINAALHPDLPRGAINWGLLTFTQAGKFEINQAKVDDHIEELRYQLKACEHSVFAWVQAYNKYMTSIVHSCASPPAHCFGREHTTSLITTLQRIHLKLFPDHNGSVTAHLGEILHTRFGISDIPSGWYFWPIAMGGMGLQSPFIPQFAIRDEIHKNPAEKLTELLDNEKEIYRTSKENWDNGTTSKDTNLRLQDEPFLSYEEYVRHGEGRFPHWKKCYEELMSVPSESPCSVKLTEVMAAEMEKVSASDARNFGNLLSGESAAAGSGEPEELADVVVFAQHAQGASTAHFGQQAKAEPTAGEKNASGEPEAGGKSVSTYWKWVVACFGEEMVKKWGGLEVVMPGSLPVGMVEVWKSRKVMWEK